MPWQLVGSPTVLPRVHGEKQTSTNYVDYYANGFKLTDGAIGDLNSSDGTYIYLAIA